jgi:hypothetical protein
MFRQRLPGRHGDRRSFPPAQTQGFVQKLAHLRLAAPNARQLLDPLAGLSHALRRPRVELRLQQRLVRRQCADGRFPVKPPYRFQAACSVGAQHPLDRGPRHRRKFDDLLMKLAMRLEPQDFHAPLHIGAGIMKAVVFDASERVRGKFKMPHPCVLAQKALESRPPS